MLFASSRRVLLAVCIRLRPSNIHQRIAYYYVRPKKRKETSTQAWLAFAGITTTLIGTGVYLLGGQQLGGLGYCWKSMIVLSFHCRSPWRKHRRIRNGNSLHGHIIACVQRVCIDCVQISFFDLLVLFFLQEPDIYTNGEDISCQKNPKYFCLWNMLQTKWGYCNYPNSTQGKKKIIRLWPYIRLDLWEITGIIPYFRLDHM